MARGVAALCLCLTLAACAARQDVPTPQVGFAETSAAADPDMAPEVLATPDPAPERRRGFLGFLRNDRAEPAPVDAAPEAETLPPPDAPPPAEYLTGDVPVVAPAQVVAEPSRRPRPFGFLFKRVPGDVRAPVSAEAGPALAALPSEAGAAPSSAPAPAASEDAPQSAGPVAGFGPGVILPFGQLATACGLSRRDMGTEVDRSPGSGKYRLYDTAPGSTEPRAQFLTGFDDGCARQFTASLALFGTTQVHEATRYNPLNTNPYSDTDEAYEKVKTRICGVRRGVPCPEKRAAKLSRDSAFVSVYRGFGDTSQWLEMFIYRGEVESYQLLGG